MGVQERRQREREARRKSVLDATRTLVRERGYNGTTTKQIAAACELSEATLFFYFQSKDEIFTSLLFEGIEFMQARIEELAVADLPAEDVPASLWSLFEELRREHPEYFHVFASLANPGATASVSEAAREELARRSGDNFRRVAELLVPTVGGERVRVAADMVWSAFVGLAVLHDSRENLGAPPHPSGAELGAALQMLLDGMGADR